MRSFLHFLSLAGLLALAVHTTPATAAPITFNDQASFLQAISNPGTDTFNDLPLAFVSGPLNRTAGSHTYRATVTNGFYQAGSVSDVWLSTNTATNPIVFNNFSANVQGFGGFFFGSDFSGNFLAGHSILISALTSTGNLNLTLNNTTTGTFFGFVTDGSINSVTVQAVQNGTVWPTVNNLTLGQTVPEPGTFVTLGLGLAATLFGVRRRKVQR